MSKRSVKNISLILLFVFYILAYKLFIFDNFMKYSELISASFVFIMTALSIKLLGYRKDKPSFLSRNIFKVVLVYILICFIGMYALGFKIGFLKNAYSLSFPTMLSNIFAPVIIIICVELFRYVVLWANKDKKIYVFLFTIILTLFEISISVRTIEFADFSLFFKVFATILLPVTIKNIVLSYLSYNVGYKVPMVYRLIMDVYIFVVPIIPDLGDYLNSMILISLPVLIYINSFTIVDEKEDKDVNIIEKSNFSLADIPITALLVVLAALISGFFPHFMIGVGSNSMSPVINRGDAIIIRKVSEDNILKKGDIIAYDRDKKIIVHRIEEVTKSGGKVVYVTKGDANNGVDSNVVKTKQVRGVVKVKIPFIAYPTVWLTEFINNR